MQGWEGEDLRVLLHFSVLQSQAKLCSVLIRKRGSQCAVPWIKQMKFVSYGRWGAAEDV